MGFKGGRKLPTVVERVSICSIQRNIWKRALAIFRKVGKRMKFI